MTMWRAAIAAALLAVTAAPRSHAQSQGNLACQSELVSMSDTFTATCCADSRNCQSGTPRQCSASCAAVWN
eukprot:SAG11_NODE_26297_length_347_cov_0.620968_1_plen_70_part_10